LSVIGDNQPLQVDTMLKVVLFGTSRIISEPCSSRLLMVYGLHGPAIEILLTGDLRCISCLDGHCFETVHLIYSIIPIILTMLHVSPMKAFTG